MNAHDDFWGNFTAVGARGARYGLIGHDSADVVAWLADHPEFTADTGSIYFDYGNDEPQVEVTEVFFVVDDEPGTVGIEGRDAA